jgi:predicted transposase/invertase (TIGR01784 family)
MKTDSIFYRIFKDFPSIFFELINNPTQSGVGYEFSSIEVKQTAFRIDGVFLPTQQSPENPIYFVEVQFQPDSEIYSRLISEVFLYIRQNQPESTWRGIVIYPSRTLEVGETKDCHEFFSTQRVRQIYLDELGEIASLPLAIATIKLIIENEITAISSARELINRVNQGVNEQISQQQLLELIETILVYKFPTMDRQEIEAMFGISELKQTRVYQQAKEEGKEEGKIEGKLESVPRLLALGLTVEQIAQALELELGQVQQIAQQMN